MRNNLGLHNFHDALLVTCLNLLVRFGQVQNLLTNSLYEHIRGFLLRTRFTSEEQTGCEQANTKNS